MRFSKTGCYEESSTNLEITQITKARAFDFRPWVRKTGLTIVAVAFLVTLLVISSGISSSVARYGWVSEPFVAVYLAVLWIGGARVYLGTYRPIAEMDDRGVILRPLHTIKPRQFEWKSVEGTEQMIRGDRLVFYFRGARGLRHVAINLNLIQGRRDFLHAVDVQLLGLGFTEKIRGDSRYLKK